MLVNPWGEMCRKVHSKLSGEVSTGEGNVVRKRLTESVSFFALCTYVLSP